jgi:hypothetical protein
MQHKQRSEQLTTDLFHMFGWRGDAYAAFPQAIQYRRQALALGIGIFTHNKNTIGLFAIDLMQNLPRLPLHALKSDVRLANEFLIIVAGVRPMGPANLTPLGQFSDPEVFKRKTQLRPQAGKMGLGIVIPVSRFIHMTDIDSRLPRCTDYIPERSNGLLFTRFICTAEIGQP